MPPHPLMKCANRMKASCEEFSLLAEAGPDQFEEGVQKSIGNQWLRVDVNPQDG